MFPAQAAIPRVKYGLENVQFLECLFLGNLPAHSKIDSSFILTWCFPFHCAICFTLFVCKRADMFFAKQSFFRIFITSRKLLVKSDIKGSVYISEISV